MTFLEKAMEITRKNENGRDEADIIIELCPRQIAEDSVVCGKKDSFTKCKKCWSREMPETEFKQKVANPPSKETLDFIHGNIEVIPQTYEDGYAFGLEDGMNKAWELVRKLEDIDADELRKMFGFENNAMQIFKKIYDNFTPQEALAKMKAYEDSQKIEVGDVVKWENKQIIVTCFYNEEGIVKGIDCEGKIFSCLKENVTKTGKHIDVQKILDQIGE